MPDIKRILRKQDSFNVNRRLVPDNAAAVAGSLAGIVKAWVEGIEILCVKLFLYAAERFTETLEVYHLPGS